MHFLLPILVTISVQQRLSSAMHFQADVSSHEQCPLLHLSLRKLESAVR
uniref:Uncharacterized protein n=1 Tax=Arundo donax TaxID=35708 RepID=A0A0A9ET03_ARUDO